MGENTKADDLLEAAGAGALVEGDPETVADAKPAPGSIEDPSDQSGEDLTSIFEQLGETDLLEDAGDQPTKTSEVEEEQALAPEGEEEEEPAITEEEEQGEETPEPTSLPEDAEGILALQEQLREALKLLQGDTTTEEPATVEVPDPDAVRQQYEKDRSAALEEAAQLYQISEEDGEEVLLSPHTALSKLAGNMHVTMLESFGRMLRQALPVMLKEVQEKEQQEKSFTTDFYKKWPAFKGKDKELAQARALYAKLSPGKSLDEQLVGVGALMHLQLGVPAKKASGGPIQPRLSATSGTPRPAARNTTSRPPVRRNTKPVNPYEAMAEEDILDDS